MRPVTLQLHDVLARPLVPIVQEVGLRGLPFDVAKRDRMVRDLAERLGTLDATLAQSGVTTQNSPKRLGWELLQLGVPLTTRSKGGGQLKVDLEILGRLNWRYNTLRTKYGKTALFPFLGALIEHAKLTKARENLESFTPCFDGKVRTRLNACATKTSRYASAAFKGKGKKAGWCPVDQVWGRHGANLQNVPRKDERYDVNVKECFVAEPGWKLGELDYKALELFIEAYRTRSDLAIRELEGGADIHTANARRMFDLSDPGVPVPKPRRTLAKNFRYALRGGGGDRAIQIALAKGGEFVELHEIEPWRRAVFSVYPEIPAWIDETRTALRAAGRSRKVIRNAFGRPRVLLGTEPLKEALATEISGTAAEIMNFVLLRLAYEQPATYSRIVAQIHDSFLLYAPESELDEHMRIVAREMCRPVLMWDHFRILQVDGKIGASWGALKEWVA